MSIPSMNCFVAAFILALLCIEPSQARFGACFAERCSPTHGVVAVDGACSCIIRYRDACVGCPCVVVSDSCRPADGPQITDKVCATINGTIGGVTCERKVVGKRCLCSGNVDVQCRARPSSEPVDRRFQSTEFQGGYVQFDNEKRVIRDANDYSEQICEAVIYPEGEIKNKTCTQLSDPAVRRPVEAF